MVTTPTVVRRGAKASWLAVCALLVAGLGAEVALRVAQRRSTDAARRLASANVFEQARELAAGGAQGVWLQPGISYRPGAVAVVEAGGERYEIRINSLGFRAREFSPRKLLGTFRVVCIGGSTTVQGRTNDETYPALLEARLRQAHPGRSIEVLNLGISGTSSDYWLARLDRLFGFEPDLVIEYDFVNDLFFDALGRYVAEHRWRTLLSHSLLADRLLPVDAGDFDVPLLATMHHFHRLEREAELYGASYVVGSFAAPDPERVGPAFHSYLDFNVEAWSRGRVLRRYSEYYELLGRHNKRLEDFARQHGLRLAPIARRINDPSSFTDICHMTPRGIESLADAFFASVSELVAVPPAAPPR
jgi:hypothetical protein